MTLNHAVAALTLFAVSTAAHAAPTYQLSGTFEDGGFFNASFLPPASNDDRCPADGFGCFFFERADDIVVTGEYAFGRIFAVAHFYEKNFLSYHLLPAGTDGSEISFVFAARGSNQPEWMIVASFEYLANGSLDTPWDGTAAAIGSFVSGYIDNTGQGYHSPISSIAITVVPEPVSASMTMSLLVSALIATRRRMRRPTKRRRSGWMSPIEIDGRSVDGRGD